MRRRRRLQILVLAGGAASLRQLQAQLRAARKEQQGICEGLSAHSKRPPAPKVAVDAVFARRLLSILKM